MRSRCCLALADCERKVMHSLFTDFVVDMPECATRRCSCLRIVWHPFADEITDGLYKFLEVHGYLM